VKTFVRSLCGPGGGGIREVVAGTGEVVPVGGGGTPPFVVPVGVVPVEFPWAVEPFGGVPVVTADEPGWAFLSPPEDTITAASAPPPASTATAAMSQAFLTRREATLARR
jgi:hypothetical protein